LFVFALVKSDERQTNCLPLKSLENVFENLNDAIADIISMRMFAACKVKMERIILCMRNRHSAFVFRRRVPKFCENSSRRRKL